MGGEEFRVVHVGGVRGVAIAAGTDVEGGIRRFRNQFITRAALSTCSRDRREFLSGASFGGFVRIDRRSEREADFHLFVLQWWDWCGLDQRLAARDALAPRRDRSLAIVSLKVLPVGDDEVGVPLV